MEDTPYNKASDPSLDEAFGTAKPFGPANEVENDKDIVRDVRLDKAAIERLGERTGLHKFFIAYHIVTALTAGFIVFGQIWGMFVQKSYPMEGLLRLYTMAFAVLAFLNETEMTKMVKESLVLRKFITRGLFYMCIGCMSNVSNDIGSDNFSHRFDGQDGHGKFTAASLAESFMYVISWIMLMIGISYLVMGLLCLDRTLVRLREDYKARKAQIKRGPERDWTKWAGIFN